MKYPLKELIPHAPNLGVYVHPKIPRNLLQNAIGDYAPDVRADNVVVLLDLTLFRTAKDGALFGPREFVFQNNNLQAPHVVAYRDVVGVKKKRRLLSCKLILSVNSGRATYQVTIDFGGRERAVDFFHRFFREVMFASD